MTSALSFLVALVPKVRLSFICVVIGVDLFFGFQVQFDDSGPEPEKPVSAPASPGPRKAPSRQQGRGVAQDAGQVGIKAHY